MATTEAVFEVFFGDLLMVLGLLVFGYRSVTHVCKSDGPTPASLPGCFPCQFRSRLFGFTFC